MKYPALTRALAAILAVFCIVTLLAGGGSLWKTRGDRAEYLRQQLLLRDRIDNAAALDQSLKTKEHFYDASSEELEARLEAHEKAASDYRGRLATYTATRAGVKMGLEQLEQASNMLWKSKRYFQDGLAEFQKGAAVFDQVYQMYLDATGSVARTRELYNQGRAYQDAGMTDELNALLTPEMVLGAVASTRAGIAGMKDLIRDADGQMETEDTAATMRRLGQMMDQLSGQVGNVDPDALARRAVEQAVARADALIAERTAQGVSEAEALAEADAVTQATLGMSYSEAKAWLADGANTGGQAQNTLSMIENLDSEQLSALLESFGGKDSLLEQTLTVLDEEEQALAAQEETMRADPTAMSSGEALLALLDTVAGSGERIIALVSTQMEDGKRQMDTIAEELDTAGKAIEDGITTVARQRLKLANTRDDLDRQRDDMAEEKQQLAKEQLLLDRDRGIVDDYEQLRKDFRSARAALMSYDEIRTAVEADGELLESAEAALADMTARQEKEIARRAAVAAIMLTAAVIGILCVAGGFERPRMENLWFLLLLTALTVGVGQAGSVEMGRGLWYSSLALGITALGLLPLSLAKAKET